MSEELKKCPFCGKNAELCKDDFGKFLIQCKSCNVYIGVEVESGIPLKHGWKATFETIDDIVSVWNRRVQNDE